MYLLLPPLDTHTENYYPFDCLFAVVASFKLVSIAYKIIFEQSSFDVFMIDWERPKCRYYDSNNNLALGQNGWRQIFLMNEFCELQLSKLIGIEFTLLIYIFLFEGIGFKHWATHDPDVTYEDTNSPSNYVLRFFITACLFLIVGSA